MSVRCSYARVRTCRLSFIRFQPSIHSRSHTHSTTHFCLRRNESGTKWWKEKKSSSHSCPNKMGKNYSTQHLFAIGLCSFDILIVRHNSNDDWTNTQKRLEQTSAWHKTSLFAPRRALTASNNNQYWIEKPRRTLQRIIWTVYEHRPTIYGSKWMLLGEAMAFALSTIYVLRRRWNAEQTQKPNPH